MSALTVGVTVYNGGANLEATLRSILEQTYPPREVIVIDDGSTDGSREVLEGFVDARVRLVLQERNAGISESRNRLLDLAQGDYLALTDQDDLSFPDRLRRQVEYLDGHPQVGLVASRVKHLRNGRMNHDPMPVIRNPHALHMALFFGRHNITYSSVCLRLAVVREHGLRFRQEYHYAEDFEFYHRFARVADLAVLPEALVAYRFHPDNASRRRYEEMTANGQRFLTAAYRDLLGRQVPEEDIRVLWRIAVERRPAATVAELRTVGALMSAVEEAFEARRAADEDAVAAVQEVAAQVWWSIIQASTATLGTVALREAQTFKRLCVAVPPHWLRAWWAVKGSVRRRVVGDGAGDAGGASS